MECQRRWKSLRDKYVREVKKVKKVKKGKSGDEGPPLVSCWPLFELMTFIDDTVRHRPYETISLNLKLLNYYSSIFAVLLQTLEHVHLFLRKLNKNQRMAKKKILLLRRKQ